MSIDRSEAGKAITSIGGTAVIAFAVATLEYDVPMAAWVLAIAALVGGYRLMLGRWPFAQQGRTVPPRRTPVLSFGQEGGVTTGNAKLDQAPKPEFQVVQVQANYPAGDGTHRTIYVGTVVSPCAAFRLVVEAQGPLVQKVELRPMDSGTMASVWSGNDKGSAFARIDRPVGRYRIEVTTAEQEGELELSWDIS